MDDFTTKVTPAQSGVAYLSSVDTLEGVEVPEGVRPLTIWVLGRWGGGMVIALFLQCMGPRGQP